MNHKRVERICRREGLKVPCPAAVMAYGDVADVRARAERWWGEGVGAARFAAYGTVRFYGGDLLGIVSRSGEREQRDEPLGAHRGPPAIRPVNHRHPRTRDHPDYPDDADDHRDVG